jgi:TRAP-type mannitol/chloroaromatic compound transport system permease large subunit
MSQGLDVAWQGRMPGKRREAAVTIKATAMVFWSLFGANIFIALYIMVGGGEFVNNMLLGSGLGKWMVIWIMMLILIFLGCFVLGRDPDAHRPPLRADHPEARV